MTHRCHCSTMARIQCEDEERRESIVTWVDCDNFSVTFCPRRVGRAGSMN